MANILMGQLHINGQLLFTDGLLFHIENLNASFYFAMVQNRILYHETLWHIISSICCVILFCLGIRCYVILVTSYQVTLCFYSVMFYHYLLKCIPCVLTCRCRLQFLH